MRSVKRRNAIHARSEIYFTNNTIIGYDVGLLQDYVDGAVWVSENRIEHCSTAGIDVDAQYVDCDHNTVLSCGTGMTLSASVELNARGNVVQSCDAAGMFIRAGQALIDSNLVGRCGGQGIAATLNSVYGLPLLLRRNTSYLNGASGYFITLSGSTRLHEVDHNISYGNDAHGLQVTTSDSVTLGCNDWFGNTLGATQGLDPSPSDLAVDPSFCDLSRDDVHLAPDSPLLDAPGCGLIGALGPGCDSVTTAALVTSFTAEREAGYVRLRWRLGDPARFADLWVERADVAAGPWARVAIGETTDGDVSVGLDRSASAEREYWYRLAARSGDEVAFSDPVRVEGSLARRFELTSVAPNPGFGPVRIDFTLPRQAVVEMDLFDLQGRHLASLLHGSLAAGAHVVEWSGRSMVPGVYLLDYHYPGGHQIRRVVRFR